MMKIHILSILLIAALLAGCGSPQLKLRADFDRSRDFFQYKTYNFLTDTDTASMNVLDRRSTILIEDAIADEILDLGMFQKLDEPQLIIYYEAMVTGKRKSSAYGSKYAELYDESYTYQMPGQKDMEDREGTLSIYFYDLRERQIVWQGTAYGALSRESSENAVMVFKAINKLFAEYPGRPQD